MRDRGECGHSAPGSTTIFALHLFPAVCREKEMHRVILHVAFLLQVRAQQFANLCGSVCEERN